MDQLIQSLSQYWEIFRAWFQENYTWLFEGTGWEILLFVGGGLLFAARWLWLRLRPKPADTTIPDKLARRNRAALLDKVERYWLTERLEDSLQGATLLALGMVEDTAAVPQPLNQVLQPLNQPERPIPPGTPIEVTFAGLSSSMLILGEPGAGKTTTLLALTKAAVQKARESDEAPIPVVFPLSSWAQERKPLEQWLLDEFNRFYNINAAIQIRQWLAEGDLLLLLDGLDEVDSEHRAACAGAINTFISQQSLQSIVVTSRTQEYEQLGRQLRLAGAVRLLPLKPEQIDSYLGQAGPELRTLRQAVHDDKTLAELARTPLWLNLMVVAYAGLPATELLQGVSKERQQDALFDRYLLRVLHHHRRSIDRYPDHAESLHYLRWLAGKMKLNDLTHFAFHYLQPQWLGIAIASRLWPWLNSLVFGVIFGVILGVAIGGEFGVIMGVTFGVVSGLIFILIAGFRFSLDFSIISYTTNIKWSFASFRKFGLLAGLSGGLFIGVYGGLVTDLASGLGWGLIGMLTIGLSMGLSKEERTIDTTKTESPSFALNQALFSGLVGAMGNFLIIALASTLILWLTGGLIFRPITWLIGGLLFGITHGWDSIIRHYLLRLLLVRKGVIPWRYQRFLDYACDRIILRRVGGSYTFQHRLLMDHIAALDDATIQAIARGDGRGVAAG